MLKSISSTVIIGFIFTSSALALAKNTNKKQSGTDFRARTIYFIVTDRFNNSNPKHPYIDRLYPDATNITNCFKGACSSDSQWRKYWGGNISGVIQKLGYLKQMGISAIWVTPLMENVRAYDAGTGWGTGYHGYWIQNYYRVNQHFGTWGSVDKLSNALHQQGMRYIQDITLNHSNANDSHVFGALYQSKGADKAFITSYADDIDPKSGQHYYKHYQGDSRCAQAYKLQDGQWSYWQLHHCLLGTLSGYNQEDPAIQRYLIGAGRLWMRHGVDDFRLDAVKYVFPNFVANFTMAMRKTALTLGKATPYIVGEWSDGGLGNKKSMKFLHQYSTYHSNLLDFQTAFALNRFIQGNYQVKGNRESAKALSQYFIKRQLAFNHQDTWQGVFLDNHDEIRSLVRLEKLGVKNKVERHRLLDLGTVLMMTVPGIPIIYYGDEQYLAYFNDGHKITPATINSDNDDPYNRVGMKKWSRRTANYKIIQSISKLRKHSLAIQRGTFKAIYSDENVMVFLRSYRKDSILVAVNRGKATSLELPVHLGHARYKNILAMVSQGYEKNDLIMKHGRAILQLSQLSAFITRIAQ